MSKDYDDFETEAGKQRESLFGEFIGFLAHNKKWWLAPIILCLALVAMLALLTATGAAPFIYTIY